MALKTVLGLALIAPLLLACGSEADDAGEKPEVVELFSWWTSAGESDALQAVLDYHAEKYPQAKVLNIAQGGAGDQVREMLESRMTGGDPPEIFQTNGGLALEHWVNWREGEKTLEWLDDFAASAGLLDTVPQPVLDSVSHDGHLYAVPVNIHRGNVLYYNRAVFETNGLAPPTTLDEFYAVADQLLALEPPVIPLAVGSNETWTLSLTFFENLMLATAGHEYYLRFFTGQASPDDPELLATLNEAIKLWGYVDPDASTLTWSDAADRVADGRAAMTIMGDWTRGYLTSMGMRPGVDFGEGTTFGTTDAFVFSGDCFPLATNSENLSGGKALLGTWASRDAQGLFNRLKGSIPARQDVDTSDFDDLTRAAADDFRNKALVPSLAALAPTDFGANVNDSLGDMVDAGDPELALAAIRANYAILQR